MTSSEATVSDATELELLRSTAQQLFESDPTLGDVGSMGLLGLLTPENQGGSGWRPVEACVVAQEAGRALSQLAWSDNLVVAAALSQSPGHQALLQEMLDGTAVGAVAPSTSLSTAGSANAVSGRVGVRTDGPPAVVVFLDRADGPLLLDCRSADVGYQLRGDGSGPIETKRPDGLLMVRSARLDSLEGGRASDLGDAATLIFCADSLGALSYVATTIRSHLVDRIAFGRPLASFQVLQHRLVDLTVLEAACTALVRQAALALSSESPNSTQLVAVTHTYVIRHVAPALDDCIQLAGGIGFTWEFPIHHAMRRSVVNQFAVRRAKASLDRLDLRSEGKEEEEVADPFRLMVREVIAAHAPFLAREGHRAPMTPAAESAMRTWYRMLYDAGLLGASWPEEWGGSRDYRPIHDLILTEELIRARAPRPIDQVQLASHVLLHFGTEDQKQLYLPKIRSAEQIWCQLFSEPDCGSDLAGIRARAEMQPDGTWRLNGQKTWTTDAHWAQMGLALLRTSTEGRRHEGITAFAVPMDSAGLEIRPKLTIGGAYEFNDVFLDGVVLGPDQVIGEVGRGWSIAMSGLEIERFGVGGNVLLLDLLLNDLVSVATVVYDGDVRLSDLDTTRSGIGGLLAEAFAARWFIAQHVDRALLGEEDPTDAPIAKILYSETYNRIARFGAELVTEHGPVPDAAAAPAQRLIDAWLWSRALTISGGSSEVMRNIIAKRRLTLPQ